MGFLRRARARRVLNSLGNAVLAVHNLRFGGDGRLFAAVAVARRAQSRDRKRRAPSANPGGGCAAVVDARRAETARREESRPASRLVSLRGTFQRRVLVGMVGVEGVVGAGETSAVVL